MPNSAYATGSVTLSLRSLTTCSTHASIASNASLSSDYGTRAWSIASFLPARSAVGADAQTLHIDIDLHDRQSQRVLDGVAHIFDEIVRDF